MIDTGKKHIHRLVSMNYPLRVFTTFVAIGMLHSVEYYNDKPIRYLWAFTIILLLWPHIAYLVARLSSAQKKTEKNNIHMDSFLMGMAFPASCFNFWVIFGSINVLISNAIRCGGPRQIIQDALFNLMGIILGIAVYGFNPVAASGRLTMLICLTCISVYFTLLSLAAYYMFNQLIRSKQSLNAAKNEAESANIAKSDFLANMSHEIRTPMNSILGMSEFMANSSLDSKQKVYMSNIRSSAEILLALINDILDLSKIEAGQLSIEQQEFNVSSALESTGNLIAYKIQEKGLTFNQHIHKDIPDRLVGDPGRLRQILLNLCSNAEKFTHQGEIDVTVSLVGQTDEEAELKFEVRDTGIGIPADKMDLLFKHFSQIDTSSTRRYGGSGLGLVISKKLVELMDGQIGVESTEGSGSVFWFTAKFRQQNKYKENASEAENPDATLINGILIAEDNRPILNDEIKRRLKILVAEDNLLNQIVLTTILEKAGYTADAVSNGREAVHAMEKNHYDIILMDVQMPEMGGLEATRLIRSGNSLNPHAIIIAVTAKAMKEDRTESEEAGMNDYVTKPIQPTILLEKIRRYMAKIAETDPRFKDCL